MKVVGRVITPQTTLEEFKEMARESLLDLQEMLLCVHMTAEHQKIVDDSGENPKLDKAIEYLEDIIDSARN